MAVDKRHVAVFTPDPSVHEGFEARGLDGARVVIPDLVEYTDDNGLLTVVAPMHYYGKDGVFVDAYDVHVPSRIAEAKEAVFAFTDRHKKALKVAGTTLSITFAVGSLIVYGKRKSGK